jgi:acyl-CoA thioester hydrolase
MITENTTQYRVCYADTDQMGVVYYANYFMLFERARTELLRLNGLSFVSLPMCPTGLLCDLFLRISACSMFLTPLSVHLTVSSLLRP